jgi:hypothetical protein
MMSIRAMRLNREVLKYKTHPQTVFKDGKNCYEKENSKG